jgi:hypothetical protein
MTVAFPIIAALIHFATAHPAPLIPSQNDTFNTPDGPMRIACVIASAATLSLSAGLALVNRTRWRRLYGITGGKVFTAFILTLLTPLGFFGQIPLIALLVLPLFPTLIFGSDSGTGMVRVINILALPLIFGFHLITVAPLIYGIRDHTVRLLAIAGQSWGTLGLAALLLGFGYGAI